MEWGGGGGSYQHLEVLEEDEQRTKGDSDTDQNALLQPARINDADRKPGVPVGDRGGWGGGGGFEGGKWRVGGGQGFEVGRGWAGGLREFDLDEGEPRVDDRQQEEQHKFKEENVARPAPKGESGGGGQ